MLKAHSQSALPVLLPSSSHAPSPSSTQRQWIPTKHLNPPEPPPSDIPDPNPAQMLDGKAIKKTRPRRTVDYNGGMGRWMLLKKMRPNPGYVPYMRPCPPAIIDLLPPKAYPDNTSTSLCTKFVHTSTNKIRCPVNIVTWTPEARRILTGSTSGEFTLWNGLTFNFETILQAHDTAICTFQFTHSGAYLASADKTGIIKYFEPNMNNLTAWQGSSSREAIRGISFSPDDRRFATASDDRTVRIWAFEESRVESVLDGHGWDVKCVQWHPSKGLIVSGSKDNQIKFWDPRSGTILSTLHQHKNTIQALAWSPNGNFVASASRDQTVRVFDIRAMKEFRVLKGHKKEVCSVTWHPFHQILVSGGSEGAIIHWDLSTDDSAQPLPLPEDGQPTDPNNPSTTMSSLSLLAAPTPVSAPTSTLSQAHDSNVWSLQYHPLGHLLVSASNDHTTRFWSRERPGEGGGGGVGAGGEKPADGEWAGEDEDEMMVPGFGGAGGWKEEDVPASGAFGGPNDSYSVPGEYGRSAGGGSGVPPSDSGYRGGGGGGSGGDDFSIPGFGDPVGGGPSGNDAGRGGFSGRDESDEFGRSGGGGFGGDRYRDSGHHNRDSGYGDRGHGDRGGGYGGGGGGGSGGRSGRWGGRRGNRY